jgi:hypothetical protein
MVESAQTLLLVSLRQNTRTVRCLLALGSTQTLGPARQSRPPYVYVMWVVGIWQSRHRRAAAVPHHTTGVLWRGAGAGWVGLQASKRHALFLVTDRSAERPHGHAHHFSLRSNCGCMI